MSGCALCAWSGNLPYTKAVLHISVAWQRRETEALSCGAAVNHGCSVAPAHH